MTSTGRPYWIELSSPDPAAGATFYRDLLGWDGVSTEHRVDGPLHVQTAASRPVAGVRAEPAADVGEWRVCMATGTVEDTIAAVARAGGKVERSATAEDGRVVTAACVDGRGAAFTVCLPEGRPASADGDNGMFCHAELLSLDRVAAEKFYGAVFGWTVDPRPRPDYTYYELTLDGVDIAGIMPLIQPSWPADLAEQWMVYFQVDDCDTAARRVTELGGTVEAPRDRISPGWVLVCRDPQGVLFNIIEFAPTIHSGAPSPT